MKKLTLHILFIIILIGCNKTENSTLLSSLEKVQVKTSNKKNSYTWSLNKKLKPDINTISIRDDKEVTVAYISDIDSVKFTIKPGSKIDFKIIVDKDTFDQQIIGKKHIPRANYSDNFKAEKNNSVNFSVPELYELVNIIVAITDKGLQDKYRVNKETDYYKNVIKHFSKYKNHKVVSEFNEFIAQYHDYFLRTNGLTYNFNSNGKLIKSNTYNRAVYNNRSPNYLIPYIKNLEDFAQISNFRVFYKQQQPYYESVISDIKNNINIPKMLGWLQTNFPNIKYNYHNIVVSPLTGDTQGLIMYDNNSFKELQIHVGLPYISEEKITPISKQIKNGTIIFSELNHGYLNKEADKYLTKIQQALKSKRDKLVTDKFGSGYYGSYSELFKEYMNWGLVALRYIDRCSKKDLEYLLKRNSNYMKNRRGFKMFPQFQEHLVSLYHNKKNEDTVADLYPQIINWFEKN